MELLEAANTTRVSAGKCASLMTKQLAFDQRLGDGCTVDGVNGLSRVAMLVDGRASSSLPVVSLATGLVSRGPANLLVNLRIALAPTGVARRRWSPMATGSPMSRLLANALRASSIKSGI